VKAGTLQSKEYAEPVAKMRIQVIIGTDYKGTIDYERISQATQQPYKVNTYPPEGIEGWVFYEFGKGTPDWGWGDYTFVVGTVEAGRHEVTGRILRTEDIEGYLINAYDRYSTETEAGGEGD